MSSFYVALIDLTSRVEKSEAIRTLEHRLANVGEIGQYFIWDCEQYGCAHGNLHTHGHKLCLIYATQPAFRNESEITSPDGAVSIVGPKDDQLFPLNDHDIQLDELHFIHCYTYYLSWYENMVKKWRERLLAENPNAFSGDRARALREDV